MPIKQVNINDYIRQHFELNDFPLIKLQIETVN